MGVQLIGRDSQVELNHGLTDSIHRLKRKFILSIPNSSPIRNGAHAAEVSDAAEISRAETEPDWICDHCGAGNAFHTARCQGRGNVKSEADKGLETKIYRLNEVPTTGETVKPAVNPFFDHYETRTRTVKVKEGEERYVSGQRDKGNGYFEDVYSTRPVYEDREEEYRDVPVYQTKYLYTVYEWG